MWLRAAVQKGRKASSLPLHLTNSDFFCILPANFSYEISRIWEKRTTCYIKVFLNLNSVILKCNGLSRVVFGNADSFEMPLPCTRGHEKFGAFNSIV